MKIDDEWRGFPVDEDWHDLPPALHPSREALTMGLVASLFLALIGWGLWTAAWAMLGVFG